MTSRLHHRSVALAVLALVGCGSQPPLPAPRAHVARHRSAPDVDGPCRTEPDARRTRTTCSCAPELYVSPLIWDGADNLVFRPLVGVLRVRSRPARPSTSTASTRCPTPRGSPTASACARSGRGAAARRCDAGAAARPGVRRRRDVGHRQGQGRRLVRRLPRQRSPARASTCSRPSAPISPSARARRASSARPSTTPPATTRRASRSSTSSRRCSSCSRGSSPNANFGDDKAVRPEGARRDPRGRAEARRTACACRRRPGSPGYLLGPFRYEGTRARRSERRHPARGPARAARRPPPRRVDRPLRRARAEHAWTRWIVATGQRTPTSSPGHVVHYYLDTSDCLGSEWDWDEISRRLGYSYIVDWGDIGRDFVTLGIPTRPWDRVEARPRQESFRLLRRRRTSSPTSGRTSTRTPPSAG